METQFFYSIIEQEALKKIEVFGHHDHQIDISRLCEFLDGGLYIFFIKGMKTMRACEKFFEVLFQKGFVYFLRQGKPYLDFRDMKDP